MIDFLIAITREAGERILYETRRIKGKKEGGGNWITEADLASEKYLKNAIHQAYNIHTILTDPGYAVLSEETNNILKYPEKERHLWVIDPLDGTTNFAYELPLITVSVAYIENGITQCGAVYDPFRKELFWAQRNKGAFLNSHKMRVRNAKNFSGALINIGSPYTHENFMKTYPLAKILHAQGARIVNLGTAALELSYVACGRLSLYFEAGLKPWDVAAGKLIVEEAGGYVESLNSDFSPFSFDNIIASNCSLINRVKKVYPSKG